MILDETGKVVAATASSGPAILRDAAVQAALKARFSPTKLSGQPVKVSGMINYKFALVPITCLLMARRIHRRAILPLFSNKHVSPRRD